MNTIERCPPFPPPSLGGHPQQPAPSSSFTQASTNLLCFFLKKTVVGHNDWAADTLPLVANVLDYDFR